MRVTDTDVIIAGAGPTGLMLAAELCLAGVRPLLLERQPRPRETPKASGFNGQIVELLRYRGLLDRIEAASGRPVGAARGAPFGGVELDFSHLTDPPIQVVHLSQPRLERLLGEHADELGAGVRRGHEVVGVSQDDAAVAAAVRGPDGPYQVTARYLVGCDGAHSKVRGGAAITFPAITYPEVNRLAQAAVPGSVTQLDNGDLDVPGLGRIQPGFTRTDRGVFAFGRLASGALRPGRADAPDRVQGQHPPRARGGPSPERSDPPVPLRAAGAPGRAVPRWTDPAGRRRGSSVSGHGHRHQQRHARRREPGLEAGRRRRRLGAVRPAGNLSPRAPLRRRAGTAPDPGPGGAPARAGPSRRSAAGTVRGAAHRRAASAPRRGSDRRHRHPLPA